MAEIVREIGPEEVLFFEPLKDAFMSLGDLYGEFLGSARGFTPEQFASLANRTNAKFFLLDDGSIRFSHGIPGHSEVSLTVFQGAGRWWWATSL